MKRIVSGCLGIIALIALAGTAAGEGAYVLNAVGGSSVLPGDCNGFATIVSDSKPVSTQMTEGTVVWTSVYTVDRLPERTCRMGFPLCVLNSGTTSELGNGYVVISRTGEARLICQGYPAFD
ncbi:MAG: hypothetical protein R3316_07360 [Rhodovibrionaceae bacterium]|nr:hypothetical protein [Rhodovibrionaceae bacterium]